MSSADKRQRPKWERLSAGCEILVLDGVTHGEVSRDFRGDWIAIYQRRPIGRCRNRIAARRAVKASAESASVNPKTEAP